MKGTTFNSLDFDTVLSQYISKEMYADCHSTWSWSDSFFSTIRNNEHAYNKWLRIFEIPIQKITVSNKAIISVSGLRKIRILFTLQINKEQNILYYFKYEAPFC